MTDTARIRALFVAAAAALGLLALVIFSQPLYDDVDNYTVALVVNGLFGKDNGCQYTHVLLNRLMSVFSGLLPGADVFTLLGRVLITGAFVLLLYMTGIRARTGLLSGVLLSFFLFLSVCISLFSGNYGIQAIFFAGTGITVLRLADSKTDRFPVFFGALLLAFGFLWRLQVSLLFVPFLLLEVVCGHFSGMGKRTVLPLALVFLLFAVQAIQERREPLMSSLAYDRPRIRYQDYGAKDWPEVEAEAQERGITHAEYEMVDQWLLLDTGTITAKKLQDIAGISGKTDYPLTPAGLLEAVKVLRWYFVGESVFNYVWLLGIVLGALAVTVAASGIRGHLQPLLILLGGQLIIFIYLILGRAPMRLIHSVYLVQSFALLWAGLAVTKDPRGRRKSLLTMGLCLLLVLFGGSGLLSLAGSGFQRPQLALNARIGADDSALRVADEEGVIIWDNWGQGFNRPLMKQGKLPTKEMLALHLPAGDWIYGQSYFIRFLEEMGMPNPYEALLDHPHRYYAVEGDTALKLYAEHTPGFKAEPAGQVSGIPLYRFGRIKPE
ncbi:MAG: hypothetical protein IJ088_16565 [Clostridia bacterium]|nr:hypothetical protein [Clostridia bacterium]